MLPFPLADASYAVQALLTLGAVVAGALALLLPAQWALYGVMLAIPFDNYAVAVGPLGISVSDLLLVVVGARWAFTALRRRACVVRSELYLPAALFYIALLPSFFVTFDLRVSVRQAFSILMMLLTMVLAATLLRSRARLAGAVTTTLVASLAMSLLALFQLYVFLRYRVAPWQPVIDVVRLGGITFPRLVATYFDPNYFALYLIVPVVLGLFVALDGSASARYRTFAALVVLLDLSVFALTFSRGGWVTLLAFMAAFVLLRARTSGRPLWLLMLLTVIAATPLAAALLIGINPVSVANRLTLLQLGMEVMAQRPLTGSGLGTFIELPQNPLGKLAHSTYLQIGADAGIAALIAFVALMLVVIFNALRAARSAQPGLARSILIGGLFALGCAAVQSAFLNALVMKHLWVLVGLTSAAAAAVRSPITTPQPAMTGPVATTPGTETA